MKKDNNKNKCKIVQVKNQLFLNSYDNYYLQKYILFSKFGVISWTLTLKNFEDFSCLSDFSNTCLKCISGPFLQKKNRYSLFSKGLAESPNDIKLY